MFKEWEKQQTSIGHASRLFFGKGFGSEFKKIAEKFVEAATKSETGVDTVKGALIGGVTGHVLTGIGAGFAIAIVFRGLESWGKAPRGGEKPASIPDQIAGARS